MNIDLALVNTPNLENSYVLPGNSTALGLRKPLNSWMTLIKVAQFSKVCDQKIWTTQSPKSPPDLRFHGWMK